MKLLKTLTVAAGVAALSAGVVATAHADGHAKTKLRIQTHFSQETLSGQLAGEYIENITAMSNGGIEVEMFYASSVVKSAETFDAAATGILDCDMTGGAYQTGKNPAFQFTGDLMGGYSNPYQQMSWMLHGGGRSAINDLYNAHNMEFVGWWIPGPESLSSTAPIRGVDDFKGWKFRSPPGLATKVFANLGASPIVMDFNEIFTALETGIIDGADASGLNNNVGLGLYDLVEHATYPGFHSMPSDHLACNKAVWDGLTESQRRIIDTAMQKVSLHAALSNEKKNAEAAAMLTAKGVKLYDWSTEDRTKFRQIAQQAWEGWAAKTPEAAALVKIKWLLPT